jgi:hypothetical protein
MNNEDVYDLTYIGHDILSGLKTAFVQLIFASEITKLFGYSALIIGGSLFFYLFAVSWFDRRRVF